MMTAIKIWVITFMIMEGIGVISMLFVDDSSERKDLAYSIAVISALIIFVMVGIGCVGILVKTIFEMVMMIVYAGGA